MVYCLLFSGPGRIFAHGLSLSNKINFIGILDRIGPQYPLLFTQGDLMGLLRPHRKHRGPVSQQAWHDKDPSRLEGHKCRKTLTLSSPVTMTSSQVRVGLSQIFNQPINQLSIVFISNIMIWYIVFLTATFNCLLFQ